MRNIKFLLFSILTVLFISACNKGATDMRNRVASLEEAAKSQPTDDNIKPLLQQYNAYFKAYPSDKVWCPVYLYRAAQWYYRADNLGQALNLVERGLQDYPDAEAAPFLMILQGQIYSEKVETQAKAEEIFKAFIAKYPDNPQRVHAEYFFKPEKEKIEDRIKQLNNDLANLTNKNLTDANRAMKLVGKYREYVSKYPEETRSPAYLFRAAQSASQAKNHDLAIQLYDEVRQKYPNDYYASQALFFKAYEYGDNIKDFVKAKATYQEFIKLYPKDPGVPDAIASIATLGKSPEDIVKEFEAKQKTK